MNAGLRELSIPGLPAWLLYPTEAPQRLERVGTYRFEAALNAPMQGERLPLVVVSHGNGGTPWVHRDLGLHLARQGYAVAMVEHVGNSRTDNRLANTAANLELRPRQLRHVLDAVFELTTPAGVAVIGHSIGAYTALAVAGGKPACFPNESPDNQARPVTVTKDVRVRALVLLAPAAAWFRAEGALAEIDVPVLMLTGQRDTVAPAAQHAALVARGVRQVEHRVVENAGHFSFQSPFPPEMKTPDFPPAHDPVGFDRAAYQPVLCAQIEAFLREALKPPR